MESETTITKSEAREKWIAAIKKSRSDIDFFARCVASRKEFRIRTHHGITHIFTWKNDDEKEQS